MSQLQLQVCMITSVIVQTLNYTIGSFFCLRKLSEIVSTKRQCLYMTNIARSSLYIPLACFKF